MMSTCLVKVCYALLLLSLHTTAGSIHGYNLATTSEDVKCIENERQSLLTFKQSLLDVFDMLSTWSDNHSNRDCCKWKGVGCRKETGHVHMLHLRATDTQYLSGDINITSLRELQNIEHLDLSLNYFVDSEILKHVGFLSNLRYLNLSYTYFGGMIPYQLGNLSRLEYLDLRFNYLSGAIPSQLGKLTHLRYLDLGLNDLFGAIPSQLGNLSMLQTLSLDGYNCDLKINDAEWLSSLSSLTKLHLSGSFSVFSHHGMQMINKLLPKLKELRLTNCSLSDNDTLSLFDSHSNFSTSLTILDLSENMLTSSLFQSMSNFTFNIQQLYLSDNHIMSFPPSLNFPSLVILDLSNNSLISSVIFHWVLNFTTNLHTLSLYGNNLQGEIPAVLGNICTMRELDLSYNNLSGEMSSFIQNSSWCNRHIFQTLDISDNRITGLLPDLSIFSSLRRLDLSHNRLIGEIPKSVGLLYELEYLYLDGNSFEGDITEVHFTNLSSLETLDLSDNSLSLKFSTVWDPPFQLSTLGLASCKLGPSFPSWLQTQRYLNFVDISNAGITGSVPVWFWNKLQYIIWMNISNNNLIGTIPNLPLKLHGFGSYVLSSNQFEGGLPDFLLQTRVLDLSKNKISDLNAFLCGKSTTSDIHSLDLSDNQIREQLSDCWGHLNSLEFLDLSNNKLSGKIPPSITTLVKLQILALRNNSLYGELPSSLRNCTNLKILDVGNNMLSGSIPSGIGESLWRLEILSLRENHFLGTLPSRLCYLSKIRLLDLSGNNLSGNIPRCLKNFTAMVNKGINYSPIYRGRLLSTRVIYFVVYETNVFLSWKGQEYEFKNPELLLKSIHLSSNHISGDMPTEFGQLLGLVSLNLSRNNLSGDIPSDIGNLNSLEFLDLSRNHFYGRIPTTLTQIDRLTMLDLSNNSLSGKIPLGTQLQSFDPTRFEGNLNLCGKPLEIICPEDETPMKPQEPAATDDKDDNSVFYEALYMGMGLGFFTGFWGLIGPLLLCRPWRISYVRFLNKLTDYAYVMVAVNVARCQRWFNG